MTDIEQLKIEMEECAKALGISPATIGERANQGGQFYARLCAGKRCWPETAKHVRDRMAEIRQERDTAA